VVLIQQQIDLLPPVDSKDAKGLRIDLQLEDPTNGLTRWIDVSAVHTTSTSYLNKEYLFSSQKETSRAIASHRCIPDLLSPLLAREKLKIEKYSPLVVVGKRQHSQKRRASGPVFSPFVISNLGELAPMASDLQEFLVHQYKQKLTRAGPRADGCSLAELVRDYRRRFKVAIQRALSLGFGLSVLVAGQPWNPMGEG
jgi:hypothetical protein